MCAARVYMQFVGLGLRGDRTCSSPGKNGGLRGTERCPMAGPPILACGPARQKTGLALPKGAGRARLNETARCAGPL